MLPRALCLASRSSHGDRSPRLRPVPGDSRSRRRSRRAPATASASARRMAGSHSAAHPRARRRGAWAATTAARP
jgi:hypothetical protein